MDTNYTQNELGNAPPLMETKSHRAIYLILSVICYPLAAAFGIAGMAVLGCLYLAGFLVTAAGYLLSFLLGAVAFIFALPILVLTIALLGAMISDPHGGLDIFKDFLKLVAAVAGAVVAAFLLGTAFLAIADFLFSIPGKYDESAWEGPHLSDFAKDKFGGLRAKVEERQAAREQTQTSRTTGQSGQQTETFYTENTEDLDTGAYQPVDYSPAYNPFNNGYNRYPNMQGKR